MRKLSNLVTSTYAPQLNCLTLTYVVSYIIGLKIEYTTHSADLNDKYIGQFHFAVKMLNVSHSQTSVNGVVIVENGRPA